MDLKPWYPVTTLGRLMDEMLELMEAAPLAAPTWNPGLHVEQRDIGNSVIMRIHLGAVDPKSIRVHTRPAGITVSGEHRVATEQEWRGGMQATSFYGRFERFFEFPSQVDAARTTATLHEGFLEVRAPKRASGWRPWW